MKNRYVLSVDNQLGWAYTLELDEKHDILYAKDMAADIVANPFITRVRIFLREDESQQSKLVSTVSHAKLFEETEAFCD